MDPMSSGGEGRFTTEFTEDTEKGDCALRAKRAIDLPL